MFLYMEQYSFMLNTFLTARCRVVNRARPGKATTLPRVDSWSLFSAAREERQAATRVTRPVSRQLTYNPAPTGAQPVEVKAPTVG